MNKSMIVLALMMLSGFSGSQSVKFTGNWGQHSLFNLVARSPSGVEIVFSSYEMVVEEKEIDGMKMKSYGIPAVFIPEPGAPDLGGVSRWLAIPQGAQAKVAILDYRTEVYHNVEVAPAPNIPRDDDDSPLKYENNPQIYNKDAYWPSSPVIVGCKTVIRGVDAVLLSVIPFQYNPVKKELIVYKDIRFRVDFIGGNGHFGVGRLRSRFWEQILQNNLLNYEQLPKIDFYAPGRRDYRDGYEYIIISPDDSIFLAWADTLKRWRKLQGISCEIFTPSQMGGNDTAHIKAFLQNAYNTWDPAPVAFLILSDYNPSGGYYGIPAPRISIQGDIVASDNWYADMNNDHLPDMHHGRICAENESHLSVMINKLLSYERNPYTAANFYHNPLVATWWQTERWFQLCSEVIRGFFINGIWKDPIRQYEGGATPGCPWSTRQGTRPTVQYWYNLGWLPDTLNPYDPSWWNNGSPEGINAAMNAGTFVFNLRASSYGSEHLSGLTNDKFPFTFTTRSEDGYFTSPTPCFLELFMRMVYGTLGANASIGVGYSFVNDAYNWGLYDGLWPHFDPGYPNFDIVGYSDLRPCMAMTHGKYYLHTTWFADSADAGNYRRITYHLFYHHGDCFTTLFSEIPESLNVLHSPYLPAGQTYFTVRANDSSVIALTVNGEIIGVAEGTGTPLDIPIPPQSPGNTMKVTVTKANYYRYQRDVMVVGGPQGIVAGYTIIDDSIGGNGNGKAEPGEAIDYGVYAKNMGSEVVDSVWGQLMETDPYVTITIDSSWFGNILPGDSSLSNPFYQFGIAPNCPNNHTINFALAFHDTSNTYNSYLPVIVYAPILVYEKDTITGGNNNGILDPGETANLIVTIKNNGGATASNVTGLLMENSLWITINDTSGSFGTINPGASGNNSADPFVVTCSASAPLGDSVLFKLALTSGFYKDTVEFYVRIGWMAPTDTGYYYVFYSGAPHPQAPVYRWIPIDTTQSQNPGVSLNLNDDQTVQVNLPFTFKYYGVNYTQISICSNGWLAFGSTTSTSYSNTEIPNSASPNAAVFGLWDDLNPGYIGQPGDVYYYNDTTNHLFVIEWFRVPHYGYPQSEETFEIILFDPLYYPTPTGDGEIVAQYKNEMQEADNTIGIENNTGTVGIEYYFDGTYHPWAHPITSQFALKYTTRLWWGIEQGATGFILERPGIILTPNPFRDKVIIRYIIQNAEFMIQDARYRIHDTGYMIRDTRCTIPDINLKIYDVSGRIVKSFNLESCIVNQVSAVIWDGTDDSGRKLPSGVYFIHLETEEFKKTEKVILLR